MRLYICDKCPFKKFAERHPANLLIRLWRWHTGWCPGWRAYQKKLARRQQTEEPILQEKET